MLSRRLLQSSTHFRKVLLSSPKHALLKFTPRRFIHRGNLVLCWKSSRILGPSSYGLDLEIPTNKSYVEYILEKCDEFAHRDAITDGLTGRTLTYRQLSELIRKAGSAFKRIGVDQQDVVAIHLPNIPEYAPILFGIQAAGNVATTVSTLLTADEIAYQLLDSGAKYVISTSPIIGAAREGASKANILTDNVLDLATIWGLVNKDDGSCLAKVHTTDNPDDEVVCLPYSSGTTGRPKGVMLTHTNFTAHAMIVGNERFMCTNADIEQLLVMALLPFFHSYGLGALIGMYLTLGSKLFCMQKYDPEMFLKLIEKEKLTDVPLVPPIALFLAKHPMVDKFDLSSLDGILSAAAPLAKDVEELLWKRLPNVRVLRQAWGMTETTAGCIMNPFKTSLVKSGSAGVLLPKMEGMVADLETGEPVGPGVDGEIYVRGPIVTKGYLNRPEETAETIDNDGWLHTGDIGHYDEDQYFYIVDRKKELIKYKGHQVAPADLEAVLVSNPNIVDAAVIGIPDDEGGEVPKAFVVVKGEITEQQVQEYVASKVAPYKKLRGGVTFVELIPKSATGKILRRVIRDELNK